MRNDKHIALRLRKGGKSYKEIQKLLDISPSTLSGWFSKLEWSQDIRSNLENKIGNKLSIAAKKRWLRWHEEAREQGKQEYPLLKNDPVFIAGLMLYWGEGDNKLDNSQVRLVNTNSNMMRLYRKFLINTCKVPENKLRAAMFLYPDLNEEVCKEFWSSSTGTPKHQFTKTQYIKGKHPTKRLEYGIMQISYNSRQFKEKLFVWIDLFQKNNS